MGLLTKIGEDTFNLWLNVGTAKNDGERHIYALTNKKEEASTKNGVSRPVGNAIQNASFTDSRTENSQNVKRIAKTVLFSGWRRFSFPRGRP